MPDLRLAGSFLLLAGGALTLVPVLPMQEDTLLAASLVLAALGILTAALTWRSCGFARLTLPLPRQRHGRDPAKRLKIRIRCAR